MGGNKYGLPHKIKIAHMEHNIMPVQNFFGNSDVMKAHDGAVFSTRMCRHYEERSTFGKHVASSLKIIALQPYLGGFTQLKCADYEMNNAWIRSTSASTNEN